MGHVLPTWLWEVTHWPVSSGPNGGYGFWSGIGSGSPILIGFAVWWRHHNCHIHRCWRVSWHPHPVHGHPVCRRHHPADKSVAA